MKKLNNSYLLFFIILFLFGFGKFMLGKEKNNIIREADTNKPNYTLLIKKIENKKLNKKIIEKENLIRKKLLSKGYNDSYIIISEDRDEETNKLLPLSAKGSFHLHGKAIDVYVFDINKDGRYNLTDVDLFVSIVREVEKENPYLIGGVGTYKSNLISKQMVHFDVRGYYANWNK